MGEDEVLNDCTRRQRLDTLVFVCFDSSVSATVRFLDRKHLGVPIKIPRYVSAGEHCGALITISRPLSSSGRDLDLDFDLT